jgi:hypothetical protein
MLPSTPEEKQAIIDYMNWQAPDLTVEFLQKVYVENVLNHQHAVWDVHTNVDRWWVITNPTNLYSQAQFPNMDLAVTFHVGLCLRIPRGERSKLSDLPVEPLAACFRHVKEASEALDTAQEVTDFQTIGVRCREALLAFTSAAQIVMPWWNTRLDSLHPSLSDMCAACPRLARPAAPIDSHHKGAFTRVSQTSNGKDPRARSVAGLGNLCQFLEIRKPTRRIRTSARHRATA